MQTHSESRLYEIICKYGLHLEPASIFVKIAHIYDMLDIRIKKQNENEYINGKSIMNVITLAAVHGSVLEIQCTGPIKQRHEFYRRIEDLEEKIFKKYKK